MTTERERFEEWASGNTAKGADGNYESMHTATMWAAWQAALSAPPGYVLVPVEPTPEMVAAIPFPLSVTPNTGIQCYRSMLAAAPSAKEPQT